MTTKEYLSPCDSISTYLNLCFFSLICFICVASLQKGPHAAKIKKMRFLYLNRAGHDKSVKKISVLAQIFTKLWSI